MSLDSPFFLCLFVLFFIFWNSFVSKKWFWLLIPSLGFLFVKEKWALVDLLVLSNITFYCGLRWPQALPRQKTLLTCLPILLTVVNLGLCKTLPGWPLFGVSFFSFQLISYTIDISRGALAPEKNLLVFLTSSSCFLYLSSGPVVRAIKMLPQMRQQNEFHLVTGQIAMFRICLGLAKKSFGDLLGIDVDSYYLYHSVSSGFWPAWTATLALTAQYYVDFSGYTDIAIGLGQLLGIQLPENFNLPFLATSPADHWRRWHMSLCEWFRDFVFFPLCLWLGRVPFLPSKLRRAVSWRVVLALAITVTLIGLWHAATLNYLLWAWYNGFLILMSVLIGRRFSSKNNRAKFNFPGLKWILILVTFYLMAIGRLLTLPKSLSEIATTIYELHLISDAKNYSIYGIGVLGSILCAIIVPHVFDYWYLRFFQNPESARPRLRFTVLFALSLFLLLFALLFGSQGRPFLYERI